LKWNGAEVVGTYAGSDDSVVKVSLYDGANKLADAYIGAETSGKVTFNFSSGSEIELTKSLSKVLTLKSDMSDYVAATEGSTLFYQVGSSTVDYVTNYVAAKGKSSGTTLTTGSILNGSAATSGALTANTMYIYTSKPTVTLNSSSPSGTRSPASNEEVFRFDVAAPLTGLDLNVNAIRFTINTNATGTIMNNTFNLYKSTDMNTVIGSGTSAGQGGTSTVNTATVGYVTIYPATGNAIGDNSTVTYVLKGDTSTMNKISASNDTLSISIADGDFYFDDGLEANANQKILNLPVTGGTLQY
jgi:cytochrome c biogenesis protein ResB